VKNPSCSPGSLSIDSNNKIDAAVDKNISNDDGELNNLDFFLTFKDSFYI
jgi:hypothetical protein